MEHRCTERYSSDLKIIMVKYNIPIAVGRIKNGNHWGVFVETDSDDLECEHQITLRLMLERSSKFKLPYIDMQAMVIHKTKNGFGAELDIQSQEHADLFMSMLHLSIEKPHTIIKPQNEQIFAKAVNT